MVYMVRDFFRVQDSEQTAFELSALMALEYTGNAQKVAFTHGWGLMLRHLRTHLAD